MSSDGWRPLQGPRQGAEAFLATPFTRLARVHALVVAGDTLVAIALAGTLFFSIEVGEARSEVFLYLALAMAPFAVVAPLVGPALDRVRGGRRGMVVVTAVLRAVVCGLMIDDVDSLLLFPEAFALLVLAKGYQVAKSSLVPTVVVFDRELVRANSRLAVISGVVGALTAGPGALVLRVGGSEWVLGLAAVVFVAGGLMAWQLPKVSVAGEPETEAARSELRSRGVVLAAAAMAVLRGVVGFLTLLLAFLLRADDAPSWHFGLVLGTSALAALAGAAVAPAVRTFLVEERIITLSLAVVAASAGAGAYLGALPGATVIAAGVGVGAASAKQAFDSIVQRDAPDANRGRSFARFETRFQMAWVAGGVLGIVPIPERIAFVGVAVLGALGGLGYVVGSRNAHSLAGRRLRRAESRGGPELAPDPTWVQPGPRWAVDPDQTHTDDEVPLPPVVPPSIATPDPTRLDRD